MQIAINDFYNSIPIAWSAMYPGNVMVASSLPAITWTKTDDTNVSLGAID